MTQEEALDILKLGYNVYLTGPAGSGKTFLLDKYIEYLKQNNRGVGITASTGIAATHINGITIHSWSGMGIKSNLSKEDLRKLIKRSYLRKRFKNTGVLIIDEISMLNDFQFDLISQICQAFKNNQKPFGGMQLICSGDFFQLPPIRKEGEPKFVTESNIWNNMKIKICYLEEQYRQEKEEKLYTLLNNVRNGEIEQAESLLANINYGKETSFLEPTKLYTHNADVDAINDSELSKIAGQTFDYDMQSKGNKNIVNALKAGSLAPERLVLKKGAKVIFIKNNFEQGYVNGTLGKVVGFNDYEMPVIEILTGRKIEPELATWRIEEDNIIKAEIRQIPLRLAWAITVHKSQGMNLDAAEIDLSKSFVEGMGYVALSRLRSLEGLKLLGINKMALMVNQKVLELDKNLKQMSKNNREELEKISGEEKEKRQKDFLEQIPIVMIDKKRKEEQVSTYKKTELLVSQKLSIKEIASQRNLSQQTIIAHLEKLKQWKKEIDLSYLNQIPEERFNEIKIAFGETGDIKLAPLREILGHDFSYQELRLARLFLI